MSNDQNMNNNETQMEQAALSGDNANSSPFDATAQNVPSGVAEPVPLTDFGTISKSKALVPSVVQGRFNLNSMLDVPVSLVFEVGRTKITIAHLMELREGSYIDLRNVSVDVIDVLVDDQMVAEAEAISLQQRYGVRISEITEIPSREDVDDAS